MGHTLREHPQLCGLKLVLAKRKPDPKERTGRGARQRHKEYLGEMSQGLKHRARGQGAVATGEMVPSPAWRDQKGLSEDAQTCYESSRTWTDPGGGR